MGAHQVRDKILLHTEAFGELVEAFLEFLIGFDMRLAHRIEDSRRTMFGRDLELTADMMANKLTEEALVGICHQIIIADTGADKNALDLRNLTQLSEEPEIILMIDRKVFTGCRCETFLSLTKTMFRLFFTGRVAEIGSRAADVMNISFKVGKLGYLFCFLNDAFNAA